jgi:hypothetical protein
MADELDPTLDDNEEMGRSDEDIRDRVDDDEEFEEIEDDDSADDEGDEVES